jgi:hypothetical protein
MNSEFQRIAHRRSLSRRDFLRAATGAGAACTLRGLTPAALAAIPRSRTHKVIVVTFGGGARDEETFAPDGQENIPNLIGTLIPQAAFCTQVVNHGILGHYVATASLATGCYETFDNFVETPPSNRTVFERYRQDLRRPASDTWVIAPSNGFSRIGQSSDEHDRQNLGAGVILPKHLLSAALAHQRHDTTAFQGLLQDNYENPFYKPAITASDLHLSQLQDVLRLSVEDFVRHAQAVTSADELSVFVMRRLMDRYAPSLLWITLHDMDVAHAGAYSLYIEGVQRTDRLCGEIFAAIQANPEYKNKTTLLILPDFGRDSDFDAGGNGFQHHRTGDALSRTTWMMALGPNIRENTTVDRRINSLDLAPTLAELLGFSSSGLSGRPVAEVL